jgi:hypothetical protein
LFAVAPLISVPLLYHKYVIVPSPPLAAVVLPILLGVPPTQAVCPVVAIAPAVKLGRTVIVPTADISLEQLLAFFTVTV